MQELIERLRELARGGAPAWKKRGICQQGDLISLYSRDWPSYVMDKAELWPLSSGSRIFPIEGNFRSYQSSYAKHTRWTAHTYYGDRRRAFCAFLADCLEWEDSSHLYRLFFFWKKPY